MLEELAADLRSIGAAEPRFPVQRRILGEARLSKRLAVTLRALSARRCGRGTADHPDPLVTVLDQVLREQLRGLGGRTEHDVDGQLSDAAIESDHGDPCVLEPAHARDRPVSRGADDRAVDSKRRDGP